VTPRGRCHGDSRMRMKRICRWLPLGLVLPGLLVLAWGSVWAEDASRAQFYQAENAYQTLLKSPSRQKLRDQWLQCIRRFETVYRNAPESPWAAAGLYRSGELYLELHRRSGRASDLQEAVDIFERLTLRYPKSAYRHKASAQLERLRPGVGKPAVTQATVPAPVAPAGKEDGARERFAEAEECYRKLLENPQRNKYRDIWLACIERYLEVQRSDPGGPFAVAGLYKAGALYLDLFRYSFSAEDEKTGRNYLQQVVRDFPDSRYRPLAAARLADPHAAPAAPSPDDSLEALFGGGGGKTGDAFPGAEPSATETPIGGNATITGLRYWSNPNYTRLVVDVSDSTTYLHHLLKKDPDLRKPQRLYIDFNNSRLGRNIPKAVPIDDDLLIGARAGQYSQNTVRVVIDLKSYKTYKIFSLMNPFRIVIDVWGDDSGRTAAQVARAPAGGEGAKLPPGALARQLALGVSRIVIDAGHGGKDPGALGYRKGVREKDITLSIARRLAHKIRGQIGCEVILTRQDDRYLTLEERTALANTKNADLFISIHVNAHRDRNAHGIETYFLNLATDEESIRVAAMENATSTKNISDLQTILMDLMQNAKINESSRLAGFVQSQTAGHLSRHYSHINDKGVKQAPFYVLLGAQMPSILIETAFISNPRECQRLTEADFQDRLCDGIVLGIQRYIRETSPAARLGRPAYGTPSNG
jgi:N-acetylmuramoyl-L-alanine amidase